MTMLMSLDTDAAGGQTSDFHSFKYDGVGRQYQADTRTIGFTDFDLPRRIKDDTSLWYFEYDANHGRALKRDPQGRITVYVGKLYEKRLDATAAVTHVMYVYGERGAVLAQVTQAAGAGSPTVDYMHNDQLNSLTNITSSDGSSTEMRFDPFGARIETTAPPSQAPNPLPRMTLGFTGQESEDDLGLYQHERKDLQPEPDEIHHSRSYGHSTRVLAGVQPLQLCQQQPIPLCRHDGIPRRQR